jgi:ORF6N domain
MAKNSLEILVQEQKILNKIYVVRGEKVMLDKDLAVLFNVETKRLKETVKRNITRFPKDFMLQLSDKEWLNLRSQIATSSDKSWGGIRYNPMAFTEQGVTMLSCVLNSEIAINVNLQIVRVFVKMREYAMSNKEILLQLAKMEKETSVNSKDIENIFAVLKELLEKQIKPITPREPIGFKTQATKNNNPEMKSRNGKK